MRGIGVETGWTSVLAEMSGSGFSERPNLRKKKFKKKRATG